jgi:hypothetical protein
MYYAGHKIDGKPATVEWSRLIKQHEAAREADFSGAQLDAVWTEVARTSTVIALRDALGDGLPRRGGPGGPPEPLGTMGRVDASCADPAPPEEPGTTTGRGSEPQRPSPTLANALNR